MSEPSFPGQGQGLQSEFGPNIGLVEEMHRQFLENPIAVSESWRDFFADYKPRAQPAQLPTQPAQPAQPAQLPTQPAQPAQLPTQPAQPAQVNGAVPLRGAGARIVENMERSLAVPTATSVRPMPAKLLEVNRQILNNHLARTRGGKVSFTHLIGYAVLKAAAAVPAMNASFLQAETGPSIIRNPHVNLGLAVDVKKSDGSHSLLVPNIKNADTLDFPDFLRAYEDLIHRVRTNKITPDDFSETTMTITNPGTIGTVHSVPRLMPGQGVIVGVGAIAFPPEYEGADPQTLAQMSVGKVVTLTSTYDHRIIQGAESGEFLARIHELLIGADGFYDEIFAGMGVPYEPAEWRRDTRPQHDQPVDHKQAQVYRLLNMYRVRGHLIADLDPLGRAGRSTHPELDPTTYGLTLWDLDREFRCGGFAGRTTMPLRDILGVLRDAYSRTIGVEYMHIQEPDQKIWIQAHIEGASQRLDQPSKLRILERLNAAEAFERFLHTKYLGHKRFSLEGAESLIPMLDALLDEASEAGVGEVVMGMAHRGRLNVLANIIGKSYEQIFREFEGDLDPNSTQGSGDVKYHLGATGTHPCSSGRTIEMTLASNPSHLEAVDPVVEGMVRAKQDRMGDAERNQVLALLLHGDAAFAGQGVVAETLNLSELPGYEVGGTVHIVVNNQLGFTTAPEMGRSSVYATDVAKMVQAPIFHVNGDDPEACVRVIRLAYAFRKAFHKDVVVDMVCYRRYGHNEADEPAYTQPRMYALIDQRRSVRKLYTEALVNRGDITLEEAEAALEDFRTRLERAFAETHESTPPDREPVPIFAIPTPTIPTPTIAAATAASHGTSVDHEVLDRIITALASTPEGFALHPKLERQITARRTAFDEGTVDWALGEALAFGSLLMEGTAVRLAGQDSRRGTFSQRHAVLVDYHTEAEHIPLASLHDQQAPFMIYDSLLSEYAAMGFEYGYSVADPGTLTCWEAQFGDFVNGAQIIIDQFIAAAEDKWGQMSGLVLLLPHGFEGQGPEHSSARLERFLTVCARDNLQVAYPTTAAQYFHLLRRQARLPIPRPLIVMTPKRYLRMPASRSSVQELTTSRFKTVLDDPTLSPATFSVDIASERAKRVERILLCTGKIGHELIERRDKENVAAAVVRIEQLAPFPIEELRAVLDRYPAARSVWWVQEEPENMGAWNFVHARLHALLRDRAELRHISRPENGSPATGSQRMHEMEQEALMRDALAGLE